MFNSARRVFWKLKYNGVLSELPTFSFCDSCAHYGRKTRMTLVERDIYGECSDCARGQQPEYESEPFTDENLVKEYNAIQPSLDDHDRCDGCGKSKPLYPGYSELTGDHVISLCYGCGGRAHVVNDDDVPF